jgi:beta-galactosidase
MKYFVSLLFLLLFCCNHLQSQNRTVLSFNKGWKFFLGDTADAKNINFNDNNWRKLTLPHDWSIEGKFDENNPSTFNEAALPTGIGWYRKLFVLPASYQNKKVYIDFDGVYCNSQVWINGHYLGKRPNGYISFRYNLTPFLHFKKQNIIAVKVNNSAQPNSRWYTGSGIYRNVWLTVTGSVAVNHWGTFVTTPQVSNKKAEVHLQLNISNQTHQSQKIKIVSCIINKEGKKMAMDSSVIDAKDSVTIAHQSFNIYHPKLWSVQFPYLYSVQTKLYQNNKLIDTYVTATGFRSFYFNREKGFFLNGKSLKILGVCMHHDLGALGVAVNTSAIERQLKILKQMGCNAIRTSHNPPAPELLDLCDKMGFLVMDEAFDMWEKKKNKNDYHSDFAKWHEQDLKDQILRDRNHPSVFMWSIGNEIREQFDSSGIRISKNLTAIIKSLDTTRPVTSALTELDTTKNYIYQSHALDVLGWNYNEKMYPEFLKKYPGQKFLASETMSALATRGHYDMPSDSIRLWPQSSKDKFVKAGNADFTVSAYDHVAAYWGSTHEATWNIIKKHDFLSGLFVWSGFDFLGEPVPYPWPARSAYYGIIDLAGFPKDAYYMYKSEWTKDTVLHLFPHWNWKPNQLVDVWAYYNNADEVELFLNEKSLGIKSKTDDALHVMWRVPFKPGTLKAVSKKDGKVVLIKEIKTAGKAAVIELNADKKTINANGEDISFITVSIKDENGNLVPDADNLIHFSVEGNGKIIGVDNGSQISAEPFKANYRKAFNGLCLVMLQATEPGKGKIILTATSGELKFSRIVINVK